MTPQEHHRTGGAPRPPGPEPPQCPQRGGEALPVPSPSERTLHSPLGTWASSNHSRRRQLPVEHWKSKQFPSPLSITQNPDISQCLSSPNSLLLLLFWRSFTPSWQHLQRNHVKRSLPLYPRLRTARVSNQVPSNPFRDVLATSQVGEPWPPQALGDPQDCVRSSPTVHPALCTQHPAGPPRKRETATSKEPHTRPPFSASSPPGQKAENTHRKKEENI